MSTAYDEIRPIVAAPVVNAHALTVSEPGRRTLLQAEHTVTVKLGGSPLAYELAGILALAPSHAVVTISHGVPDVARYADSGTTETTITLKWETGEEATA